MITVACVLKSGGVYDASWVSKLQEGVARHLSADHRFVCLSDVDVDCERIPLRHGWKGWWSKIELFQFTGPTFYVDLDSIITGPLDDLIRRHAGFTMLEDLLAPGALASGALAWRGDYSAIYERFAADPEGFMATYDRMRGPKRGDQGFIADTLAEMGEPVDTFRKGRVVSFKKDARHCPPTGASVVAFHGVPKMPEAQSRWVAEAWA